MAKSMGMSAVAITDHGNISGVIRFYEACRKNGVKPIIGMEAYYCNDITIKDKDEKFNHLVLLVKNGEGWKNLVRLVSIGSIEGFYRKPRIDWKTLSANSNGLIVLTACIQGRIPRLIIEDRHEEAIREIERFRELFGEDFYLEIQRHGMSGAAGGQQKKGNEFLIEYGLKNNVPLVATNDVHYLSHEDAQAHDIWLRSREKEPHEDDQEMRYGSAEFYFKSAEQIT